MVMFQQEERYRQEHCRFHPSGDPEPSPPDIMLTRELAKAGEILGIEVVDHVIVGRDTFVSLKERKLLD